MGTVDAGRSAGEYVLELLEDIADCRLIERRTHRDAQESLDSLLARSPDGYRFFVDRWSSESEEYYELSLVNAADASAGRLTSAERPEIRSIFEALVALSPERRSSPPGSCISVSSPSR